MTGYQKLKKKYAVAYNALWRMATASPGEWMKFHEWATKAIDELKELDENGKTK